MTNFIQRILEKFTKRTPPPEPDNSPLPRGTRPLISDLPMTMPLGGTAPLTFQTIGTPPLLAAHSQSVGRVRNHNEDSLLTFTATFEGLHRIPTFGLYIVADGMGGHNAGEKASAIAARSTANYIIKHIYQTLLTTTQDDDDRDPLPEIVNKAITEANTAVVKAIGEGGTTLTSAIIFNDQLIIGHVGDSRGYIISPNGMELLTRDHSLVQRLQELGQLTAEEAAVHPQRNVLYRAVGQGEGLEVDTQTYQLSPGSKIFLCSDGLWGLVDDARMLEIIRSASTIQTACDRLVEAANTAGGPDNITAVIIEYNP